MTGTGNEGGTNASRDRIAPQPPFPPKCAPNVLIIMTDDVGFGASSTFGGPVPTPTFDALAADGLRYNAFHTTAMCSPTRACLLTGRNHHTVGTGCVVDVGYDAPGYNSIIPQTTATVAKVLKANGYKTAMFGKHHNTPDWEITAQGPFDHWPTGLGFEYYYGFFGGAADQQATPLIENTVLLDTPTNDDYFFDKDIADRSVGWLRNQNHLFPEHPFFLYIAPGTAHSPHRAPKHWIAKFKGQFDQGWDKVREETFARQKALGIIPPDAKLTPRPDNIPAWDSLSEQAKQVSVRFMECFAAQLAYFEDQLAKVVAELKRSGRYENTLIFYVQGDNGASGDGTLTGNLDDTINPMRMDVAYMASKLEEFGGRTTYQNYPVGWGWAMDTPFQWTKQVASHFGGMRNGLTVTWPKGIVDKGGLREMFTHVIDIAPTIYEAVGITPPDTVEGVAQDPIEGVSMVASFSDPAAPGTHSSQYFEMVGNRGWYEDGWMASTTPGRLPWSTMVVPPPEEYSWELYRITEDYSQAMDLAAKYPEKLQELRAKFEAYAGAHNLKPYCNQTGAYKARQYRPYVTNGRSEFEFFPSQTRITDQSFPDLLNRSWSLEARLTIGQEPAEGTVIAQGGYFGGWGLFFRGGRPEFVYRASLVEHHLTKVAWPDSFKPGDHSVVVNIESRAGTQGAPADVRISVNSEVRASGTIQETIPITLWPEGIGVGRNFGTGIEDVRRIPDLFNGVLKSVRIKLL